MKLNLDMQQQQLQQQRHRQRNREVVAAMCRSVGRQCFTPCCCASHGARCSLRHRHVLNGIILFTASVARRHPCSSVDTTVINRLHSAITMQMRCNGFEF